MFCPGIGTVSLKETGIVGRLKMRTDLSLRELSTVEHPGERGLVIHGRKGWLWAYNPSRKLWKEIEKARTVDELL